MQSEAVITVEALNTVYFRADVLDAYSAAPPPPPCVLASLRFFLLFSTFFLYHIVLGTIDSEPRSYACLGCSDNYFRVGLYYVFVVHLDASGLDYSNQIQVSKSTNQVIIVGDYWVH